MAALGGRENAFTSKDYTAYFQQIEKSKLEAVMALEADRMANLVFDPAEFAQEIKVVMEERRLRTDDQPGAQVDEALNAAAFVAHPYRRPVIGWMDDLQNMTVDDAKAWYERWYAPNNATMVVAGDVDAQAVHALAQKYFGAIPAKTLPVRKPQDEPAQKGMRRVTVKAPAENPYVVLAFKAPRLTRCRKAMTTCTRCEVLAAVLDGYDNARLNATLVRTERVANAVGASYSGIARGPVLFTLEGEPVAGVSTEQLEQTAARRSAAHRPGRRVRSRAGAGQDATGGKPDLQARFDFRSGDGNRHAGNERHFAAPESTASSRS